MAIDRNSFFFTMFLGAIAALPSMSIDMGLPAIPLLEHQLAHATGRGALTLSVFLAGFSIAPLACGPLTDSYGRRTTLLFGLFVFCLGAVGCAITPSFPMLLLSRMVQGIAAGACVVLPLAIVRDLFEGSEARSRFSQVTAILGLAPMLAPSLGAAVVNVSGWRAIYYVQAGIGFVLFMVALFGFVESHAPDKRRPLRLNVLLSSYTSIVKDRSFRGYAFVNAFSFAAMFSFISGAPAALMGSLALSSKEFAIAFGLTACGILIGSLCSIRLSRARVATLRIMDIGLCLMAIGAVVALVCSFCGAINVWFLLPPIFLTVFCFGLTSPGASHQALEGLGQISGAAAGILRFLQMGMGSLASASIAIFDSADRPIMAMTGSVAIFAAAAAAAYLAVRVNTKTVNDTILIK